MLQREGKGVKQAMKVFVSGARKMVCLGEDEALFVGSSSSGSRWSQILSVETSSVRGTPYHICANFITNEFYIL
jgi:hypothetical protein